MNEFKWADGFDNGTIRDQLIFLKKFNINPNKFVYQLEDDSLDLNAINIEDLKQEFPNATIVTYSNKSHRSTSCVQDELEETNTEDEDDVFMAGEWQSTIIKIYDNEIIYYIDSDGILIWYHNQDPEEAVKRVLKFIPVKAVKPKEAEIKLVAYNQEYYTIDSKIQPTNLNIDENYNDDIKPVLEDIKKFLNERKSGLILLRGVVGTGKTNLIRHLVTTLPKNYILVTNTLASHLASPEFISFMLDHKNSVFIIEDCEQILMAREQNISNAIANILNLSDGLMSDIFNVKFKTFEIKEIINYFPAGNDVIEAITNKENYVIKIERSKMADFNSEINNINYLKNNNYYLKIPNIIENGYIDKNNCHIFCRNGCGPRNGLCRNECSGGNNTDAGYFFGNGTVCRGRNCAVIGCFGKCCLRLYLSQKQKS